MDAQQLVDRVTALHPSVTEAHRPTNRPAVDVDSTALPGFMADLVQQDELSFDMLLSHTAVDWCEAGQFQLVYQLYSTRHRHHLMVSADVARDEAIVPSVAAVWPVAEWQEREVYDLFGIRYDDHPDLRRIFLEDDWEGFPLRKDYEDDFMLDGADA